MSLRLFIDQCVPRSVSESFREAGHTVEFLHSHLPIDARDTEVIASAQSQHAILVTLNGDFANIISYPPEMFAGHRRAAGKKPPGIPAHDYHEAAYLFW